MKCTGSKNPMLRGAQQVSTETEPVINFACNDRLNGSTDNNILEGSEDNDTEAKFDSKLCGDLDGRRAHQPYPFLVAIGALQL